MKSALIIEDHQLTQDMFEKILKEVFPDIIVYKATTLEQGRAYLDNGLNLALVDINLPDGNGLGFAKHLSNHHSHIYTVIISIYDDDKHIFDALETGINGYILKEEPYDNLLSHIKDIELGKPPLSPSIARRIIRSFKKADTSVAADIAKLTDREKETMNYMVKGLSNREIAEIMNISIHTVSDYAKSIYRKLDVSSRVELASFAGSMKSF